MKLEQLLQSETRMAALRTQGLRERGARAKDALFGQVAEQLRRLGVGTEQEIHCCFVPGRIEVLGKHTDYAGGHTLVTAVEQGFCMAARPRTEATVRIAAVGGETVEFQLDPQLEPTHGHWSNYPMTVARRLARNFPTACHGADIAFVSDLPPASGMSSSSAMMVGTYLLLAAANDLEQTAEYRHDIHDTLTLAAYLGTVENGQTFGALVGDRGVGTFGGSEDHTAILCSKPGMLGQFGYCPARMERYLPLPEDLVFAVGFSGVVAEKTGAAQDQYNRASGLVQAIVAVWNKHNGSHELYLEDVLNSAPDVAEALRGVLLETTHEGFSGADLARRLDHYITENHQLVGPAGDALSRGDLEAFGKFVDRSQEATETLLGNQVPETMELARLARAQGAHAASAFGAGFGGSVWALIDHHHSDAFLAAWSAAYAQVWPEAAARARFFTTQAGPAAFALEG